MGCSGVYTNDNIITAEIEVNENNLTCQIINSINYYMSKNPTFLLNDDDFEQGNNLEKELKNSEILNIYLKIH